MRNGRLSAEWKYHWLVNATDMKGKTEQREIVVTESEAVKVNDSELCQLPSDTGACDEYIPAYFYDPLSRRCDEFVWSGCGGNANRFTSLSDCEQRCIYLETLTPTATPSSGEIIICGRSLRRLGGWAPKRQSTYIFTSVSKNVLLAKIWKKIQWGIVSADNFIPNPKIKLLLSSHSVLLPLLRFVCQCY